MRSVVRELESWFWVRFAAWGASEDGSGLWNSANKISDPKRVMVKAAKGLGYGYLSSRCSVHTTSVVHGIALGVCPWDRI